ncbi:hypothetical protein TSUD_244380 [Trifolium subterraneum]|uniref:Uncharacterized protein n=1 Tax=Trifolium subterraneum TaxID=3900 RepID=A0A2Z6PKX1_TRISU|nr:hypothetical protein TSUD_244380 [Trifolium subterraneum]
MSKGPKNLVDKRMGHGWWSKNHDGHDEPRKDLETQVRLPEALNPPAQGQDSKSLRTLMRIPKLSETIMMKGIFLSTQQTISRTQHTLKGEVKRVKMWVKKKGKTVEDKGVRESTKQMPMKVNKGEAQAVNSTQILQATNKEQLTRRENQGN